MRCFHKSVAVILSFLFFLLCVSKPVYAATDQKGAPIQIRMTAERPLAKQADAGAQWFKKHKWWLLGGLLAVVAIGAAASGGGGGGGGGSDSGGDPDTAEETGSGTVTW